ncbi:LuxR C-terminal-related transcriptional regulator [Gordonia sp. N1V]|uniref:helix-turn-helix transcriptional regulator n=1 Tax=Gordonia sp. N1V TaxID=3034163 RepID=UPI0023E2F8EB|nr:LuxR C-terminal-related transcriptional regulator [Gordonia sp. N1V]MDF3285153.1 LuxR C-terminal-related transcriptional regulator [Gordonia sp. N1V]
MPHDPSDRPVPTVVPDSDGTVTEAAPLFVAVAAEDDILDTALCTLVEAWGHRAGILRPDADHSRSGRPADESGTVIVVRSTRRLMEVRQHLRLRKAIVVGLGVRADDPRGIDLANTGRAPAELAAFLTSVADRLPHQSVRVRLTDRERQILTTYALGATMPETAKRHHIAESTVREHYRRVTQRYADAGKPIGNKAQLLLRLMSDGWVRPREILHAAG